jgi:peroxiredoxin
LLLADGESLAGLALLTEAAEAQVERWRNDPPMEATFLYNRLGDEYLELGAPKLAVECYERTLETVFHDGFALAGLVVAHHQLGNEDEAREAMARLQVVWSDAERPNRWLEAAEATGVTAAPHLEAPIEQRNYKHEVLDRIGPSLWKAPQAPALTALNSEGHEVELADHIGQNVLLVFYLGEECVHCIEQLTLAEERMERLKELGVVVLAVSKDEVEEIAEQQEDFELTLLSDPSFDMARRFHSHDDFEEIELHSTFLINPDGGLHWSRIGGEPFTDFDFIESEFERINRTFCARPEETEAASE